MARHTTRLRLARVLLFVERLWPRLLPPVLWVAGFAALALVNVWAVLPGFVHSLALVVLVVALGRHLWRLAGDGLGWPEPAAVRRWVEARAGLSHRPLDVDADAPATTGPLAERLWAEHRRRMAARVAALPIPRPRLSWVEADPRAIRVAVALLFGAGLLIAGPDAPRRLDDAFSLRPGGTPRAVRLDAWITPPDYTGATPTVLARAGDAAVASTATAEPLVVPQGSVLTVQLTGGHRAPVLDLAGDRLSFDSPAETSHRVEAAVTASGDIRVRQGAVLRARWPIEVTPDTPPEAAFAGPPEATERHATRFSYRLSDDYGVTAARLEIRRGDGNHVRLGPPAPERALPAVPEPRTGGDAATVYHAAETDEAVLVVDLPAARTGGQTITATAFQDLSDQYWAGEAVAVQLVVRDAAGQVARSEPLAVTLPVRDFEHPVAREMVDARRRLIDNPGARNRVGATLRRLARAPDAFDGDLMVFAALRSAYWRLQAGRGIAQADQAAELLWRAALRLEDGEVGEAEAALRAALDAMAQSLESGDAGAIADQAQALDQMLRQFLASQNQTFNGAQTPPPSSDQGRVTTVDAGVLSAMVQQIRDLAAAGRTEEARQMLDQLRAMMENMRREPLDAEDLARMRAAQQAAQALKGLSEEQREVLNRTAQRAMQNRADRRQGLEPQPFDGLAETQRRLSETLSQLRGAAGEAGMEMPQQVDRAQQALDAASEALARGDGAGAIGNQAQALQQVDQAEQQLQQQLARSRSQQQGRGGGRDPLGRMAPDLSTSDFELPGADGRRRVEEIVESLRERLSDPGLSAEERAYIERLLRRY
ncbi:uncharacterized protein (TIGR02302 family) [Rhodothalassium salexigens DSM 2132]|uniref:Uncharacterized protein (TIGR02302 family) n=1 Tax=Rhodothalassium salexigens DSM 2132 TaxID=1188247 RepID=A0A4R2PLH9_RHOSA|nr:DUF4175 family protein [Rhodothalassium salexigens]MBB4210879.1 uncharacterized protein (TIGR02302 family) [Rhodothalassium salexigens DSM 2132]MBK1638989.1 hypothetical protein [Rhodothalassium salexigens DSM 2132]TCP36463.1 uncharacterized protein (TIGR02302 family) [Rhodothalassium salexigens DSM 2132]